MKQIFLVGDSIRLGYRSYVADALKEEAQIFSSDDNARFTAYTLRYLNEWARLCLHPENVSVVHWNNGLWDACHFLNDPLPITPLPVYLDNLECITGRIRLLFPNAKIIFASSTAVAENHPRICNQEVERMNAAACERLTPLGVVFNDLHAIVRAHPEYICPDLTHLTQEGYAALGSAVANKIREVW